jgi:SHS family lactate transporter-like MFS transporter
MTAETISRVQWWKEPTRDQWYEWRAAWLGWTLDAFDFTVLLLIMVPIAKEFHAPLTAVAFVLTLTLWMRLIGAVSAGWLADRVGRKLPAVVRHCHALPRRPNEGGRGEPGEAGAFQPVKVRSG